ncbi:MAG TPA: hypothetical protein VGX49_11045 [Jatrophihabitans sp.]|jgi:hypothetical protein|nr:hypothetical protein [Jatrophihabitans sp.]
MLLLGYLLLALVVAALVFYGVVALLPGGLSLTPQRDNRPFELPADRRMVRADLDQVRIPVGVRGYRFAETDDLIDRLAAEIVVRDEEIARLRSQAHTAQDRPAAQDRPVAQDRPAQPWPEDRPAQAPGEPPAGSGAAGAS